MLFSSKANFFFVHDLIEKILSENTNKNFGLKTLKCRHTRYTHTHTQVMYGVSNGVGAGQFKQKRSVVSVNYLTISFLALFI